MKNNVIVKVIGTVRLSATIGVCEEASVLAIGGDVVVADVRRDGTFRYRQVLENTRVQDVDFNAKINFVEYSEHKVSAPGDFVPLVRKGDILVADYNMSGTHYFRLSEEDRAWLAHRDGIEI